MAGLESISSRTRSARTVLLAVLLGTAGTSVSAATYDDVCGDAVSQVSQADLLRLTSAGETALASPAASRGDVALVLLAGKPGALEGPPAPAAAVARYCLVAGEAMRISKNGSDREAKALLVAAFKQAGQAGEGQLAARAALQLGLSAAGESGGGAAAGLRGATDEVSAEARETMRACAASLNEAMTAQADFFTAAAALECAAATGLQARDHRVAAVSNLRLARLDLAYAGRDPLIEPLLRRDAAERLPIAIEQGLLIADPDIRAEVTLRAIETLLSTKSTDAVIASALDALAPSTAARPAAEAYRLAMLARLAAATGRADDQRRYLARAIFTEAQQSQPLRLANWYLDLAAADPARRGEHVASAYRALESVRPLLPQFDPVTQESTFQLSMRAVFEQAAEFQLAGDRSDGASIARAQAIIERYRQAELQNVFGSECIAAREALRTTDLVKGEMILYPVLLPGRVELLYATGTTNGFQRLTSPETIGRAEVATLVEQFVNAASTGGDDWRDAARRLYTILVKPVLAQSPDTDTLVIVPDGPLRSLPFAALLDDQGKFLVERARVVATPALGYAEPGKASGNANPSVLALALSKEVDLPAGNFPRLEGTTSEARAAAGATGLYVQDFSKADLQTALDSRKIDILHLSTHASFNGRADRAFIVADGEAIRLGELREMIADGQARGDMLNLLVLGACETAVGDDQASMGLAGAAVQAGARSAVASLWQVNDLGTATLMRGFYDNLRLGRSKAESLRDAQLAMIRSGPEFANPNIWSAFILLGGWR